MTRLSRKRRGNTAEAVRYPLRPGARQLPAVGGQRFSERTHAGAQPEVRLRARGREHSLCKEMGNRLTGSEDRLAQTFRRFGERECVPSSPLYGRLAIGIAGDAELLAIAATARARPVPNLFLAAVQFLLLQGIEHPLAAFYPGISGGTGGNPADDPFPVLCAFCLEHAGAIEQLLMTRRVQTNEVRRCACLLPAFAIAARRLGDRPLALVEIGASAGL